MIPTVTVDSIEAKDPLVVGDEVYIEFGALYEDDEIRTVQSPERYILQQESRAVNVEWRCSPFINKPWMAWFIRVLNDKQGLTVHVSQSMVGAILDTKPFIDEISSDQSNRALSLDVTSPVSAGFSSASDPSELLCIGVGFVDNGAGTDTFSTVDTFPVIVQMHLSR